MMAGRFLVVVFVAVVFASLQRASSFHVSRHIIRTNDLPTMVASSRPRRTFEVALSSATTSNDDDDDDDDVEFPDDVTVLGVAGGIGCGKSLACRLLAEPDAFHGCVVEHVEADKLAHAVYAPGSAAVREIVECFGEGVVARNDDDDDDDDAPTTIDRASLGAIVFQDPAAMSRLERIVWPHVRVELARRLRRFSRENDAGPGGGGGADKVAVVEAAVLLDAGWSPSLSALWVVTTSDPGTALDRLVTRRGLDADVAAERVRAQSSRRGLGGDKDLARETARGEVQAVVRNDGSETDLSDALRAAWNDPSSWRNGRVPSSSSSGRRRESAATSANE